MSGRVENKKSRTHKSYKQLRVPLLKTVDKIYFNFGIFYNKIIDEKPISSGYRVKSNELFSENTENAVKMIDFIEIYGKIKTCRVIDK